MNRSGTAALCALFVLFGAPLSCGTSSQDDDDSTDNTGGSTTSTNDPADGTVPTGQTQASGGAGNTDKATGGSNGPGNTTTPTGGTSGSSGGSDTGGTSGSTGGSTDPGTTTLHAILVKSAYPLRDPNGPDTQSSATTEPYNTHVFADVLEQHLTELGVTVEIVDAGDCSALSCIHVPDASSTAEIVVFVGGTYNASLPQELIDLIPALQTASPAPVVTSTLTSCGMGQGDALSPFVQKVTATGVSTIPAVWLQATSGSTLTDQEMHEKLTAFAQALVDAT